MLRLPRALFLLVATVLLPSACTAQGTGLIEFDHYHSLGEIGSYLESLAAQYPQLVTLELIGRSREGRAIWAVDVNNPATGSASEKPGFYVDGNIHGGEVLGGEGALAFLDRIVGGHGSDRAITDLVDTRAFYVVPIVNPDGRAISVGTPENHRWNVRATDEDGDGLADVGAVRLRDRCDTDALSRVAQGVRLQGALTVEAGAGMDRGPLREGRCSRRHRTSFRCRGSRP